MGKEGVTRKWVCKQLIRQVYLLVVVGCHVGGHCQSHLWQRDVDRLLSVAKLLSSRDRYPKECQIND